MAAKTSTTKHAIGMSHMMPALVRLGPAENEGSAAKPHCKRAKLTNNQILHVRLVHAAGQPQLSVGIHGGGQCATGIASVFAADCNRRVVRSLNSLYAERTQRRMKVALGKQVVIAATCQKSFNCVAQCSTKFLPLVVLSTTPKRWCITGDALLLFVLGLCGAKPVEPILIAVDDRKTMLCFVYPEVDIGGMASKLICWQTSRMIQRLDEGR
jgi:hypothetical protein